METKDVILELRTKKGLSQDELAVVCRLMIPRSVKNRMVLSMKNTVNGVILTENSHMTILMI